MSRFHAQILLVALLSACGSPAPGAPQPQDLADSRDSYAACRADAKGDAAALIACADAAIAASGKTVDNPATAQAFQAALRQLGDDAANDGGQAAQVTFADAAVGVARARAALLSGKVKPGRAPAAPRLGAAAADLWARSRRLSCADHRIGDCAARYDALLLPLNAEGQIPMTSPIAPAPAPTTGLPLPSCAEVHGAGKIGGALADAFYARYPKVLAGEDSVETVALDAKGTDNIVRYLVCVAGAVDYDPVVAENGLALFASKRHGKAALAALDALGASGEQTAVAARRFRAQIAGYLSGSD